MALRLFAVVLLAYAVVFTPLTGAAVPVGAHPQAGAAFDDPNCHVLRPAPADPFAASGSDKHEHWHTSVRQCDDVPTRAHVLYLSNVCFNDLTVRPDYGVMVLRSPLPLARVMNHTRYLGSAAQDDVSPLHFLNGSPSKGMRGFQAVPTLVVGESEEGLPAKDSEVPVVWHPGLTLIIRPPKDHNVARFWEGLSVLWHVLLHPHLYPWLLRVQLVFTPNFGSDEFAYSRDLFDVVLHKLCEVQSLAAARSGNSTANSTHSQTTSPTLPLAETPTTTGSASADSGTTADAQAVTSICKLSAPATSNRRRLKVYPPFALTSTGMPLLGGDAMDHHHPVNHCFTQAAFPGNMEAEDGARVFVGPADAARVRELVFQRLSTPLLPLPVPVGGRRNAPVRVAFIDRCPAKHSRCIVNHGAVLAGLQHAMETARWRTPTHLDVDFEQWLAELSTHFPGQAMNGSALSFSRLSLAAQVAVARNADVLVGVAGAGLANSVMMEQGSVLLVVSLMEELHSTPAFRLQAASSGNRYMSTPTFSFSECMHDKPIPNVYVNSPRNPNLLPHLSMEGWRAPPSSLTENGSRTDQQWQPSHFSFNVHSDSDFQRSLLNLTRTTGREHFRSAYHCSVNMSAPELRLLQDTLQHAAEHVYTTKRAGL